MKPEPRTERSWWIGIIVLVGMIGLPTVGLIATTHVHAADRQQATSKNELSASAAAYEVAQAVQRHVQVLEDLPGRPSLTEGIATANRSVLRQTLSNALNDGQYCRLVLAVAGMDPVTVSTSGPCWTPPAPLAGRGLTTLGPAIVDAASFSGLELAGAVAGRPVSLQAVYPIRSLIADTLPGAGVHLTLVAGITIVSSNLPGVLGKPTTPSAQAQIRAGRPASSTLYSPFIHTKVLVAYEPVPGTGFGVFYSVTAKVAFASADHLSRLLLWGYLLLVGIALGLAGLVTATLRARVRSKKSAELALHISEERFRLAFDTAPVGMAMIALSGPTARLLRVNSAMCLLTGRDEEQLGALDLSSIAHPDDIDANEALLEQLRSGEKQTVEGETRFLRPDGSTVWGQLAISMAMRRDGEAPYGIGLIEDITARKKAEEALVSQSLHDPLTGLGNRTLLHDRIGHALAATSRSHQPVGVLYIDLDGFKQVNDSGGHHAGDQVLVQVGERLRRAVRPGDTVARIGGDEFAVVCVDVGDLRGLRAVADRCLETLRPGFQLDTGLHYISGSIGMALSTDSHTPAGMLAEADAAMYRAKDTGKDRIATPHIEQQARAARTARLLPEIYDALEQNQFIMYGQPILDLSTYTTVAVETLMRWQHPTRGVLPPGEFLEIAEHSPLMIPLGQRALAESCRMAAIWSETLGPTAPDLHVNVSGRQLESGHLSDDVLRALSNSALPANRLILELTETHMPAITDSLLVDLNGLRDLGIRIAIDDLGTGHSSLTRITELPVDILKIDLQFTAGIGRDPACDAVVRAVLSLGEAMGLSVVAEGVETPEQAELLHAYGCDIVQGYLCSKPLAEQDLLDYFAVHIPRQTSKST